MNELLRLEQVRMHFRARSGLLGSQRVRAVDGVTVSLGTGETLALVGESGSGKTTLARIALRLLRPTAGQVVFQGQDITRPKEGQLRDFRRQVQGIFQDPFSTLDPYMTVGAIVEEPLVVHGLGDGSWRRERVARALEEVRLQPAGEFMGKYPHMMSGGQRQRAGVARALVLDPAMLVADEPVSMVDASSRAEVLHLLRGLQERRGIGVLYITHDLATARHFSQRTAVMYLGRVVELGPTKSVIEEPLHPYTVGLLESVPEPDPTARLRERPVIPGEPPSPVSIPSGCRFHPRCPRFMPGRCEVTEPALQEVKESHFVACHLYG